MNHDVTKYSAIEGHDGGCDEMRDENVAPFSGGGGGAGVCCEGENGLGVWRG